MVSKGFPHRRIGALETENRLLFVADREECSFGVLARTFSGKELLGQGPDDLPLLGIGVLGFIDQDMVEPAIELEENPRRHRAIDQKIAGAVDEIVIIETALRRLRGLVGFQHHGAEAKQGSSAAGRGDRAKVLDDGRESIRLRL